MISIGSSSASWISEGIELQTIAVQFEADSTSKSPLAFCDSAKLYTNDPDKAIAFYERCLKDLIPVGRYNRLYQTKRRITMEVIALCLKHSRFDQAYRIAFAWIKQDKWDMDAKIHYARVLKRTPGKEQQAQDYYEYLKKEFYNLPIDQWLIKK